MVYFYHFHLTNLALSFMVKLENDMSQGGAFMKANEASKLLRVTRPTLNRYVAEGKLKATITPTKRYNYDDESVYELLNNGLTRYSILYTKGSDLSKVQEKIKLMKKNWLTNITIDDVYYDVDQYGKDKTWLYGLLQFVNEYSIKQIFMYSPGDLIQTDIELVEKICEWHGTKISYYEEEFLS